MRLLLKRGVELGLCRSGLTRLARRLRRQDVLVLAYHNVVPDGEPVRGERSLHIRQGDLHRQLSLLARTHQFTSLRGIRNPGSGRARVAVTFDDAYRGAVQAGVEVLAELGVPATVFVVPSCLGGQWFWWDLLSQERDMDPRVREHALHQLQGKAPAVLAWMPPPVTDGLPDHHATATPEELDAALGYHQLELGSHTWSHPNLATLEEPELLEELRRPLQWLRARYGERVTDLLSYPYGRWSPDVARLAREVGYGGGFRIEGGWVRDEKDLFAMPRRNVPRGLSLDGFELRASGLLG